MTLQSSIKNICNSCLFQLLTGIVLFLSLSCGLTLGCYHLVLRWPSLYWIVAGIIITLLVPLCLLVILCYGVSIWTIVNSIFSKKKTLPPAGADTETEAKP